MTSTCWQITFTPSTKPDDAFNDFLDVFFEVNAQNYADSGLDEYIGYQSGTFNEQTMLETARASGIVLPPYKITELRSENWLKDYVIEFPPFETSDFCIYGIHEKSAPPTSKIPLQIYAATAFGSSHQTTQSCIKAISELCQRGFVPERILDLGTGSGILSLCAAKLWPEAQILAADIDDEAVIVTEGNARTNNINQIEVIQSDGYQNPSISAHAPYDLIMSNILANPLIAFAADLSEHLAVGGYAVLSGFVDDQSDEVIAAHSTYGLRLIKLYSFDNWRAALLQKA